ncbi:response regulator [Caballeronia sp. LjRoot34]|uniref:response regulator n=1 Tax=Caballeronia sp. LjRoot34 TaxID=3342325 RepID=UPI003ED15566
MLKVFLVDDSSLIRRRISAMIGALDDTMVVGEAEDCDTALDGVQASGADLAIVDFRLTGSTGLTLVEALARGSVPIITMVLTNCSSPAYRAACYRAGADYFFDKTAEVELARETIARLARALKVIEPPKDQPTWSKA